MFLNIFFDVFFSDVVFISVLFFATASHEIFFQDEATKVPRSTQATDIMAENVTKNNLAWQRYLVCSPITSMFDILLWPSRVVLCHISSPRVSPVTCFYSRLSSLEFLLLAIVLSVG